MFIMVENKVWVQINCALCSKDISGKMPEEELNVFPYWYCPECYKIVTTIKPYYLDPGTEKHVDENGKEVPS